MERYSADRQKIEEAMDDCNKNITNYLQKAVAFLNQGERQHEEIVQSFNAAYEKLRNNFPNLTHLLPSLEVSCIYDTL